MIVSATGGTLTLLSSGAIGPDAFWPTWSVWWTGDAMGILVVVPFLLSLPLARDRMWGSWPARVEALALYLALFWRCSAAGVGCSTPTWAWSI